MSLKPLEKPVPSDDKTPQPESAETPKKLSKTELARETAKKYLDLEYAAARDRIMEEAHVSKSVAHKALKYVQAQKQKSQKAEEKPTLKLIAQEDEKPAFLEEEPKPSELGEPAAEPCLTPAEEPATPEISQDQKDQIELFQAMLRGTYVMLFSKEGLADKYGRPKAQCEQLADQQFRWLMRRYGIDEIQRFDTILLVGAYATVLGGIAKEFIDERRKNKKEKSA